MLSEVIIVMLEIFIVDKSYHTCYFYEFVIRFFDQTELNFLLANESITRINYNIAATQLPSLIALGFSEPILMTK
jgi:hypothetical protein